MITELDYKKICNSIQDLYKKIYELEENLSKAEDRIELLEAPYKMPRHIKPKKKTKEVVIHTVNLMEYEAQFNDVMWKMVEVIGKSGAARYPEIEKRVKEEISDFVKNRLRVAANELVKMKILDKTELHVPLMPMVVLYALNEISVKLFKNKFKATPVQSEMKKVIKEHDNLEHGYGILSVGQLLADKSAFKDVIAFNRSIAINIGDGRKYIPDITGITEEGERIYFEYERGTHTQKDFNEKCNKMCRVTESLNFIVQNKDILEKRLFPQVKEWIKSRGGQRGLQNITIGLTTPVELRKCNLSDESWLIVYNMDVSDTPVINKMQKEEQAE